MKEKEENSYGLDDSLKEVNITNNNIDKFRQVLNTKEFVRVNINYLEPIYINMNLSSYYKIIQMLESYPEDNILFVVNKTELYTPKGSFHFSRSSKSSIINNKEEDSSFSIIKLQSSNKKSLKEEIINTDILRPNTISGTSNINKVLTFSNEENIDNIKIENEIMVNNIKNMQLFSLNDKNNNDTKNNNNKSPSLKNKKEIKTSADKKLVAFKWLYHYYIILSIIIFFHYITFIFSDYNYANFYKLIALLLIISLAFVGYIGIKYKYTKSPFFIFNGENNLFWVHLVILILTIFSFSALLTAGGNFKFISSQGILGYLIALIYLISLIIEGTYTLYYDVIIEEINWDRNNNKVSKINEYIDNKLNIQLTDID